MHTLLSDKALLWLGAVLYLGGFAAGCYSLSRRQQSGLSLTLLNTLLAFGLATQTAGLYARGLTVGGCPLGNKFEIVQFVAWSAMVLYFVVGPSFRVSLLGLFTAGYASILAFLSLVIPQWDLTRGVKIFGNNPWIEFHAALAVFSYGVFGLLAITSMMYLLQNWSLKHKNLGNLFWFLPSMSQLDQITFRLLLSGVSILTLALCVGATNWVQNFATVDHAKLAVTLGVWSAYLAALLLRWRHRLVSTRFAWVCVGMFLVAMLSLGPVNSSRHHQEPTPASR